MGRRYFFACFTEMSKSRIDCKWTQKKVRGLTAAWVWARRRHNGPVGGWRKRRGCASEAGCQLPGRACHVRYIVSLIHPLWSPFSPHNPVDKWGRDSCSRRPRLRWQWGDGAGGGSWGSVPCKLKHLLVHCLLIRGYGEGATGWEVGGQGRGWLIWRGGSKHDGGRRVQGHKRRRRRPGGKWWGKRRGFVWWWSRRETRSWRGGWGCVWGRWVRWWWGGRFIRRWRSVVRKSNPSGRCSVLTGVGTVHGAKHVIQVGGRRASVRGWGEGVQVDGGRAASCPAIG